MAKSITLKNDFHNSSVVVRIPEGGILSKRTTDGIYKALCGIDGCTCGGIRGRGIRGQQEGIPDGMGIEEYSQDRLAIVTVETAAEKMERSRY